MKKTITMTTTIIVEENMITETTKTHVNGKKIDDLCGAYEIDNTFYTNDQEGLEYVFDIMQEWQNGTSGAIEPIWEELGKII